MTTNNNNAHKGTKKSRVMETYIGHKGAQTMAHINRILGSDIYNQLTGKQYGLVMSAINQAYHEGKASMDAEVIDGDYVWINKINKGIDIDVLRRLVSTEKRICHKVYYNGNLCEWGYLYMTHDSMAYADQRNVRAMQGVPRDKWGEWYRYEYEYVTTWELMPQE